MKMLSRTKSGHKIELDGRYWNDVASKMKDSYTDNPFFRYKKQELLGLINLWGKEYLEGKILKTDLYEEALGYDDFLFDLAKNNINVYGIDISSKIVALAKKKAKDLKVSLHLSVQDVRKLDLKDESFDLIISNSTLDHFPEIEKALLEIYRTLKKDGVLILTLLNKNNLAIYLLCKIMRIFNRYYGFYTEKAYSLREIRILTNKVGFEVVGSSTIIHTPPPLPTIINVLYKSRSKILKSISRKLISFFKFLGRKSKIINYFTGYLIAVRAIKK